MFPKIVPKNHPFLHRVFHYKPSILGVFPLFFGNIHILSILRKSAFDSRRRNFRWDLEYRDSPWVEDGLQKKRVWNGRRVPWLIKNRCHHLGVSKNRGIPKWMVKIMENPIKIDDLGVPLFSETSISIHWRMVVWGARLVPYTIHGTGKFTY